MGAKAREHPKGSGIWYVFINHDGRRQAKKIGDRKTAMQIAEKVQARIALGQFDIGLNESDSL